MNNNINIGIVGIGNCASSLVQGLQYYKDIVDNEKIIPGLIHPVLGGYKISDIRIVACFDIDRRKVGKDIGKAIFAEPNCTKMFCSVPNLNVEVLKTCTFDGVAKHMQEMFLVDNNQKELTSEQIVKLLKEKQTDILINYLPVGTQMGTNYWTDIALYSGCAFVNCIPVFVASNKEIVEKFKNANLPIIGDDIKSQCGATILHRAIINMLVDRGAKIISTYQTNIGGNTDFANMISETRLTSKRISKTESVSSQIPYKTPVYAGPNGYIASLKDNKICNIRIDFDIFGDIPCSIDCKLSVEDSPNSAGIVIDCIRLAKIAKDRKIGGVLLGPSAWTMKHPPEQIKDEDARKQLEDFIDKDYMRYILYRK